MTSNSNRNKNKPFPLLIILLVLVTIALSGCGGSSGGGSPTPTPLSLTISQPTVVEGDSGNVELIFTVTLSEVSEQTLTIDYTTQDDTATIADNDYTAVNGSLMIPAGSTTANVSVFANGDTVFEQNESFNLVLSNAQGVSLDAASYSGQGLIDNDDDANPKGYFTGTATLNSTDYTDLTALVFDNRILLFSPTANVLYDIAMTAPTVFDYNGTVEVYVDGNIEQVAAVTVTGTTNELQITGTFAGGTGFGAGSFDVAFDTANNRGATLARIEATGFDQWMGNFYGVDVDTGRFGSNSVGEYFGSDDNIERCGFVNTMTGFVIPDMSTNIYQMAHPIENQGIGTCAITYESTGHTGFAAVVDDTGTDDKMVFAFNNDTFALFGIMNK